MRHLKLLSFLALFGVALAIASIVHGYRPEKITTQPMLPFQPPYDTYIAGAGMVEATTGNIAVGTPASGRDVSAQFRRCGGHATMLVLAMTVGLGVAGVMPYMFTYENLKQYAVLKAMGASHRVLLTMVFIQACVCALLGTGLGIGLCAVVGEVVGTEGYPFRMMWFTPLAGILGVATVSITAAAFSVRPLLKLEPGMVFAGR